MKTVGLRRLQSEDDASAFSRLRPSPSIPQSLCLGAGMIGVETNNDARAVEGVIQERPIISYMQGPPLLPPRLPPPASLQTKSNTAFFSACQPGMLLQLLLLLLLCLLWLDRVVIGRRSLLPALCGTMLRIRRRGRTHTLDSLDGGRL